MFDAIKNSDFDKVKSLLQAKASANCADEKSFTPIMWACSDGDICIAKILLDFKADAAYTANDGTTALSCAGAEGYLDVSRLLVICAGVAVNSEENTLQPLHMAVQQGKYNCVKFLLDQKADPNLNSFGAAMLQVAAAEGKVEMVDLLLEYGADPNKGTPKTDTTPLFMAIQKKNMPVIRSLLRAKSDVDYLNKSGLSPIQFALNMEAQEALELLIKHTASVNRPYNLPPTHKSTLLLFAIDVNNSKLIKAVLECKADVNKSDSHGVTPLLMAARFGDVETVRDVVYWSNILYPRGIRETNVSLVVKCVQACVGVLCACVVCLSCITLCCVYSVCVVLSCTLF